MTLREKILPMPYVAEEINEEFVFDGTIEVLYNEDFGESAIELYKSMWNGFSYGGEITFTKSDKIAPHSLCTKDASDAFIPCEDYEYSINITSNGFALSANDKTGLVHALMSLIQTISPRELEDKIIVSMPIGKVYDKPMMNTRAIHLCVFPETTLDSLERSITLAGFSKFSHIVIEFWGSLKYDCADYLSWKDAYTKDQIRPLIQRAKDLSMEVIPMINHFGHATMSRLCTGKHVILDQNPKMAMLFEPDGWTWCLSNPKTIALLKQMREELCELCGSGEYFHFGCDEAYSYATCDICSKKDKLKMLTDYLNYLADEAKSLGRRAIIWGDMFLDRERWDKKYYALSWPEHQTHKIIDDLSRDLIIADWQYEVNDKNVETAAFFKENGFDVLLCPWERWGNISGLSECVKETNLMGAMSTTWHTLEPNLYLIFCSAENFWSNLADLKEKYGYVVGRKYENYELIMAKYLRFLFPANGEYEKCGWQVRQVGDREGVYQD